MALVSWHDTFASLDTDRFGTSVAGSGSVAASGGSLVMTSPATADAAVAYCKTAINTSAYQVFRVKARINATSANSAPLIRIMDTLTHLTGANTDVNPDIKLQVTQHPTDGLYIAYYTGSEWRYWKPSNNTWTTTATYFGTTTTAQTWDVYVIVKPGYLRIDIVVAGGTKVLTQTDWLAFTSLASYTTLYVAGGDAYTNYYTVTAAWDDFWYQGDTAISYGFYNGKQHSGGYSIGKAFTLDGKMFYRSTRDAVLTPAAVGYDNVKDPYCIKVGSTLYLFYAAYTSEWKIGYATSTNDGDTFTDQGVILEKSGTGWRKDGINFPVVAYDGATWHVIAAGVNGTTYKIGYFSGTDIESLSEGASNPIIDVGTSGAWNDAGVFAADMTESSGTFTLWVAGLNATTSKWQSGTWTASAPGGPYTANGSNPVVPRVSTEGSTLSANSSAGGTTLVVADASPFSAGDPIVVSIASGYSGSGRETNRIKSIASSTLTLEYPMVEAFSSGATVNCYNQGSLSAGESGADYAVMTSFQHVANLLETTALYQNVAGTWTLLPGETPPLPLGSGWDNISSENLRLPGSTFTPAATGSLLSVQGFRGMV